MRTDRCWASSVLWIPHLLSPAVALQTVKVLSWNILAQEFALPQKFPTTHPTHLEWSHRQPLLVEHLRALDADLICLQEVQVANWEEFLSSFQDDYEGVLQKVQRNHPVACAVLVKRSLGWNIASTESRSRVLIVVLENEQRERLYLVNAHLEAGASKETTRYQQIASLAKRLRHHLCTESDPVIILTGDLNLLDTNPLYRTLTIKDESPLIAPHLLPLQDVYHSSELQRTHRSGLVLDYLLIRGGLRVDDVWYTHPAVTTTQSIVWPNAKHPSDHAAIGATLRIEDACDD